MSNRQLPTYTDVLQHYIYIHIHIILEQKDETMQTIKKIN